MHLLRSPKFVGNSVKAYLDTLSLTQLLDLKRDVEAALADCEDSNRHMAVYSVGSDLAKRIHKQCFYKDGTPLKPHKLDDSLKRLQARLGCHSLHSIPIGFYYAKWSEKLQFHLANAFKPERSHSRTSTSRSRTPSPKPSPKAASTSALSAGGPSRSQSSREPSPDPNTYTERATRLKGKPDPHEPKIASSSAAGVDIDMSIETAPENLNVLRRRRAAIFSETKDGMLTKEEKDVFWYREGRRQAWKAVESETMMNETEWSDRYDRVELEKLRFIEEPLVSLLEEHQKSIGDGPAGQGSN